MRAYPRMARVFLLGLPLLLVACVGDGGRGTGPNGEEELSGSPPATPSIMQLVPLAQEPERGMYLTIHDASDNEDGFRIERKVGGGSFNSLTSLSPNTDNYTDWGLEMSTQYTYRIQAYNKDGNSNWSEKTQTASGPEIGYLSTYTVAYTHVEESNSNTNFGNERYITIAGAEGYWGSRANALIFFPLPNLPTYTREFESSYLRLCEAGGGNTIYPGLLGIYAAPALNQWNENTVTWNTRPGTWLSTYGYNVHDPNRKTCVWIDVSDVVSDWYSGVRPNRGFMLFTGSNAYVQYYSREGYEPGSALLEVDYTW
jgi:hypothetical protein